MTSVSRVLHVSQHRCLMRAQKTRLPKSSKKQSSFWEHQYSVSGGNENTIVYVTTLARNFDKTMDLVEEMLLEPRWDEEQFKINKTRTINNLKRNKAEPNYLAYINFNKLALGSDNILSIDASGTEESVEAITIDDLKAFYEKNMSPSVSDFLVVGDVDKAGVEAALTDLNTKWAAKQVIMPELKFAPAPEKSSDLFCGCPWG